MAQPALRRTLSLTDVVLFNVIVIFNLRGMATAAEMGLVSLVLWVVAVAAFLVPLGYAVTEMATRDPAEGGLYRWSRAAFGDLPGFLCGWLYWVSNVTYLPVLLLFFTATVPFVFGRPALGESRAVVLPVAIGVLWLSAYLNVRGWTVSKLVTNLGAWASWLAAVLLIAAGAVAFVRSGARMPVWLRAEGRLDLRTLGYFGTLSFALAGLELAPVMGDEIQDPRRTLPRAILLSSGVIALLYLLGTMSILVSVPPADVSPMSGAIGALQSVATHAGWGWMPVLGGALVAFSTVASVLAWLGGTARLPFAAGLDRFLPEAMSRLHPKYGTPYLSVWLQTIVTTVLVLASQAGATVREAYLVLLDMTIIQYFVPFLFLFASLPRLRAADDPATVVRVPGGRWGLIAVTALGLVATLGTCVTSAIPPHDITDTAQFHLKLWGGLVGFTLVGYALYAWFNRMPRQAGGEYMDTIV